MVAPLQHSGSHAALTQPRLWWHRYSSLGLMQHLHNRLWWHRYSTLGLMQHLHNRLWWHRYSTLGLMQHLHNHGCGGTVTALWVSCSTYTTTAVVAPLQHSGSHAALTQPAVVAPLQHSGSHAALTQPRLWWHRYSSLGLMQHLHNHGCGGTVTALWVSCSTYTTTAVVAPLQHSGSHVALTQPAVVAPLQLQHSGSHAALTQPAVVAPLQCRAPNGKLKVKQFQICYARTEYLPELHQSHTSS